MSTPEKCPYAVCMDTCELLCSGQFVGINSKNARGILKHRMKQKEERNNVMKKANETVVLCGASAYEEKYYLNPQFSKLPEHIRQELQIMCVLYTQKVGGILMLEFTPEGHLEFKTEAKENDFFYDEIGSVLEIKKLQNEKRELMEALEMFYRVVFLGEEFDKEEAYDRKCGDLNSVCAGTDGGRYGPAVPTAVQRTGSRASEYGNGQCESDFLS